MAFIDYIKLILLDSGRPEVDSRGMGLLEEWFFLIEVSILPIHGWGTSCLSYLWYVRAMGGAHVWGWAHMHAPGWLSIPG